MFTTREFQNFSSNLIDIFRRSPTQNRSICTTTTNMEVNPKDGYFSLGLNTLKVPMKLFDENRQRLANALRANPGTPANSVVILQAGGEMGK